MNDTRYDKRPKLAYNFSAGKPLGGEERVSAGYKNKRPTRSSSEPRGNASVNSSFTASGRAGRPLAGRSASEAEELLIAALSKMG